MIVLTEKGYSTPLDDKYEKAYLVCLAIISIPWFVQEIKGFCDFYIPTFFMLDKITGMIYNNRVIAWARNGFDGGFAIR